MAAADHRARKTLPRDVFDGAIRGDFAPELGVAGAVAQLICGFIPIVGTLGAARDLIASLLHRQVGDALLNALSLVPVAGGVPKAAEIIRHLEVARGAASVARIIHHPDHPVHAWATHPTENSIPNAPLQANSPAMSSLLLSLASPLLVPFCGAGCVTLAVAIILGHAGLRIARQHPGRGSRKWIAFTALTLSYLYLALALAATVAGSYFLDTFFMPAR